MQSHDIFSLTVRTRDNTTEKDKRNLKRIEDARAYLPNPVSVAVQDQGAKPHRLLSGPSACDWFTTAKSMTRLIVPLHTYVVWRWRDEIALLEIVVFGYTVHSG